MILIIYVNHILLIGVDDLGMKALKQRFADEFDVKDLGSLRYFLVMEIAGSWDSVCQQKYNLDLLKDIEILGWRLSEMLLNQNRRSKSLDDEATIEMIFSIISW